ncbi:uncharacterized protein LOC118421059 [Branchiostoma floridae]|uniref:Uncharacterized protein LOC118421059 n=1 Tax=Branchiostoma floridae TaxID=7739 RepID=A0A9J7LJK0_BRAFL|nr:uncharacterized protein LOC118421059 [Branchiostoma floridae]
MKGLVFVIAVALACVATCGALKCRSCALLDTREECLTKPPKNCSASQDACLTVHRYVDIVGKRTWNNFCSTRSYCRSVQGLNRITCDEGEGDPHFEFACYYCCNTDGCVGPTAPGAASAACVSIVTMATAALAVLLKNAAGF